MTVIQYPDDAAKQARRNMASAEEPEYHEQVIVEQEPDTWLETLLIIAGLDFLIGG